jgi:predicted RNase H-like nuclease (RuvC/YqgF family)
MRLITRLKPHSIVVDNVYELAASIPGLRYFFAKLPERTRIIQVTNQSTRNLQKLGSEHGFSPPSKINPVEEAVMSAQLAQRRARESGATIFSPTQRCRDPSGCKRWGISTSKDLLKHGIETVVITTVMSHQAEETFEKFGVPVLTSKELQVQWISGYPYARREKLSTAIRRKILVKSEETSSDLAQIISQYQIQRTTNEPS